MLEKIVMVVSALLMLANEMFGLSYEKVEITAAVALITTLIATAVRRLRGEAAADRIREKELDLKLRTAQLHGAESRRNRPRRGAVS